MTAIFTSREFNQDASRVKRAARQGPVVITERGRPAHVLMAIEDYDRLLGRTGTPLIEFLEGLPLGSIDLTRDRDPGRDAPF